MRYTLLPTVLLLLSLPQAQADPGPLSSEDIKVAVRKVEGEIVVDVELHVPALPQEAWEVMTDFENMPKFISNLKASSILSRTADTVQVSQQGKASYGPFTFTFDTVREIQLKPYQQIDSRLLSGSMKKLEGKTLLAADGAGTRVVYHAVSIPNAWVPPGIGTTFIEHETREQFSEMRQEILRRKQADASK